ncbi:hypothetical protein JCM1841_004370 [Sporobolomyces salmonicolor]
MAHQPPRLHPVPLQSPRAATPFFRRPSSTRSASSSSFLSTSSLATDDEDEESSTETDSEDDDDTEGWSSSGLSGDEGRWMRQLSLSAGGGSGSVTPRSPAAIDGLAAHSRAGPAAARSNLKLSLAVLRARQSFAGEAWEGLASALKSLASALPTLSSLSPPTTLDAENPLGIFVPILDRLAKDLREGLAGDEKGREYRRTKLSKEDAKALVALRQRWATSGRAEGGSGGKGKGKEVEAEWAAVVEELVAKNPPPASLAEPTFLTLTPSLLASLESLLLPSSLPRFSLSSLGIDDYQLASWPALRRLQDVVAWYLSFTIVDSSEAQRRARKVLDGVRSLDLSKNKLTTFPIYLIRLLPHLETLSLSHNRLLHLPSWVTLLASLRRLRTHGNRLISSRKALKPVNSDGKLSRRNRERLRPLPTGTRANVRDVLALVREKLDSLPLGELVPSASPNSPSSLFSACVEILRVSPDPTPTLSLDSSLSASPSATDVLPPHLESTLLSSYTCASCTRFVLSTSLRHLPPFWERVHHFDPGVSLPSRVPSTSSLSFPPALPCERPATIEQRVLLALLARLDSRPPPPPPPPIRRTSSSTSLSSIASSGPPRRRPTRRERDWEKGRAVLPTLVIGGDGPEGEGYRFCVACAVAHLGVEVDPEGDRAEELARVDWRCSCVVCVEEKRIREGAGEGDEDGRGRVCHSGDVDTDPIDASHVGPLTTWNSLYDSNTSGDVWVEIASEAYYDEGRVGGHQGRNTVTVPSNLAPGTYLVRFDLLALHSASSAGGVQFYPNCAQINVTGSGSTDLPAGVSIPGFFTDSTPGIVWNVYYSTDYNVTGDYIAPSRR